MDISAIRETTGSPNPPITVTLESQILGEKRTIYIQLPEGYEQVQKAYPVLCVLDGEWLFEIVRANLRFYSEYEVMGSILPQMIVVGVENVDRDKDYVPTPDPQDPPMFNTAGKADLFADFLRQELFPFLEQNYRVFPNRTLVGWSFGGLFALYAAIQHQDLCDSHLCIGPAIWWDDEWVVKLFKELPLENKKRAVITCGSDEKGGVVYESVQSLLKMLKEAQPENFDFEYIEIKGSGHSWSIPEAVDRGLKRLFRNYWPSEPFASLSELKDYYTNLSQYWGFEVSPPVSPMIDLVKKLWELDDTDGALEVLDILRTYSPNCSLGHFYRGKYLSLLNQTPEAKEAYREAINAELVRPVPNYIYLRAYQTKLDELVQQGMV